MANPDLHWQPGWQLARQIAAGALSPVTLVEHCFARIDRLEPELHALAALRRDEAVAEALEAERKIAAGEPLGPLHGVPVLMKDEAWVGGTVASAGSLLLKDFLPEADGTVAARLRAAGAIVLAMTNTPEFMGFSRGANRLRPETRNPWDTRRVPGASSSGTGAGLAAGYAPLGIGSDGGGSIRIPSSSCGLFGLFPTPGRVPDTGSFSYAGIASLGPMTRDVRDAAMLLQAIAGPDRSDPKADGFPVEDFLSELDGGVAGMRFAWSPDYGHVSVDKDVLRQVRSCAAGLEEQGGTITQTDVDFGDPWPWLVRVINGQIASGEASSWLAGPTMQSLLSAPGSRDLLCGYTLDHLDNAPPVDERSQQEARAWVAGLKAKFATVFEHYDAVLSPTMPRVSPILPEDPDEDPYPERNCGTYFTATCNIAEIPAASYPAGLVKGLPVGLQVVGPPGSEARILRICRALERARPFTAHPMLAG
ncbi:MAG TPA: amidase [Novosphingobium sp.]|nr:amidase [Novosphingobium sp.]